MFSALWQQLTAVELTPGVAVARLFYSLILGAAVGIERKRRGQIAGMRTFALISMGATLAMVLSIYVPQEYLGLKNGDPGRIAAQVISGIGFLGAGAIIQMKGSVRGLTTAAGIWMVATIGLAVGVGMYLVALVATLLVLFILVLLEQIEHRVNVGSQSRTITVKIGGIVTDLDPYITLLGKFHAQLNNYFVDFNYSDNMTRLNLVLLVRENTDVIRLMDEMSKVYPTTSISLVNSPS